MSALDANSKPLPGARWLVAGLFAAALVLYLATYSRVPFPGLPTRTLLIHLRLEPAPSAIDALWGWLVRGLARLPGRPVAAGTGMISAFCGACSVALAALLMSRVGYYGLKGLPDRSLNREAAARRLSALVTGLALAVSMPFWVVSTRSLPGAFHVLLLLLTAWVFTGYQRSGRLAVFALAWALYGAGITESATFIVFLPAAVLLACREESRRAPRRPGRALLAGLGGAGLGLCLYPLNAYVLYRFGRADGLFASPWAAWARILLDQFDLIVRLRLSTGFLVVMFLSIVPWLTLFVLSRRSPWYYETDQTAMRVVFSAGLLAVLFDAPFAPWALLGMTYLLVVPYLLLAVCLGYMAGEFWILGEVQMQDDSRRKRGLRRAYSALALAVPLGVLAAGFRNLPAADARPGAVVDAVCGEILDGLAGRDLLFSIGPFDDTLRLQIWQRQVPVQLFSAPKTASPLYLRQLARVFREEDLSGPLQRGDFGTFLDNLMRVRNGAARTGIIDMTDLFREHGQLVPDGIVYRLEPDDFPRDLTALVAAQQPFWERMEARAVRPVPVRNPVRPFEDLLRFLAAKVANNLAVQQAEAGDAAGAVATLRVARRMHPENLSVLLNLIALGRAGALPDLADLEQEWAGRQEQLAGEQWALGVRQGHLWRAAEWVGRGYAWALSGEAPGAVPAPAAGGDPADDWSRQLDQIYLVWGQPAAQEAILRGRLMRNPRDTGALMAMCRLALRRRDPESAEAYLAEAMAKGLPLDQTLFDRAMLDCVRGDPDGARAALRDLSRQTPGDLRIWMGLVLLGEPGEPVTEEALRVLQGKSAPGISVHLALAWVYLARQQWAAARTALEQVVQSDPRNPLAWELMFTLAGASRNPALAGGSLRTLLANNPEHPLQSLRRASPFYDSRRWAEAETELRRGLQLRRDPHLLNALADVLIQAGGDRQEARVLVDEALRQQPFNPVFRCTSGELHFLEGQLLESAREIRQVLTVLPGHPQALLVLARLQAERGRKREALFLVRSLAQRKKELSPVQLDQLNRLAAELELP